MAWTVEPKYRELLRMCKSFLDQENLAMIGQAYELAVSEYGESKNESGEQYLSHAIEVAKVVVQEMELSAVSITSALLHDIINHSGYDEKALEERFGSQVRNIIKGLTKISRLSTERTTMNSENFIRLLLTLSDDVRVILIKLADRLHYMRSLDQLPAPIKQKIANETSMLYAPIAHRLGLYNIKTELEERSLRYAFPEIYQMLEQKLQDTTPEREAYIGQFIEPVEQELKKQGFKCKILGRTKSISSIWNKMRKQNVEFDEVYDLFAVRIILQKTVEDEKSDCWKIYSIVTNIYQPNPKRLRDWITSPKASGYEALHTTVIGQEGRWVEVQIRSRRMDDVAEKGGAAHWRYKEKAFKHNEDAWMIKIREKLENPVNGALPALDSSKVELYSRDIFVFTPLGDLKKLPAGSTVLDFAYQIHTNIGDTCTGAKVNNKFVTLKHVLMNGDQVEILTSKTQKPNLSWLNYVISPRSKAKIKRALNEQAFQDADAGKDLLLRKLNQMKMPYNNNILNRLLTHFKLNNPLELYHKIANNIIEIAEVKNCLEEPETVKEEVKIPEPLPFVPRIAPPVPSRDDLLVVGGNADLKDYKFAKCCQPVYGDQIFGFVTVGKGIRIHRNDCPNAAQLHEKYSYRIIRARWLSEGDGAPTLASLKLTGKDELGLINKISDLISNQLKLNLRSISFDTKGNKFEGIIYVFVNDTKQLDVLVRHLLKVKGVQKITRIGKGKL
jgi:GTP pyrophosphokinase